MPQIAGVDLEEKHGLFGCGPGMARVIQAHRIKKFLRTYSADTRVDKIYLMSNTSRSAPRRQFSQVTVRA